MVLAWLVKQVVETIFPAFGFGDAAVRIVTIVFGIGLVPVLIFAPQREAEQLATLEEQKTAEVEQALQQGRTQGRVESYGDKSIAVLPFVDMSSDKDQEYMSDGIAEELLNLLAKIPQLRVISRSSAFSYKGKDIKLSQVAQELNVAHILEGSVRKAGNRIRITAQLIDARSDTHLWSETYDRQLDDIFAIQDEIAATVVEQLKIALLGAAPHVKVTDPEAYAPAYATLGWIAMNYNNDLAQAARNYQKALALEPADTAIIGAAAVLLKSLGRVNESIALGEYFTARDPLNATSYYNLGFSYLFAGRWFDAINAYFFFTLSLYSDPMSS